MEDLSTHPKVEKKFPMVNFQKLVYPRLIHSVLEVKQKDVLFSLVHGPMTDRECIWSGQRGTVWCSWTAGLSMRG